MFRELNIIYVDAFYEGVESDSKLLPWTPYSTFARINFQHSTTLRLKCVKAHLVFSGDRNVIKPEQALLPQLENP